MVLSNIGASLVSDILKELNIAVEVDIVSAHRTPEKLFDYGKNAHTRGFAVIIAVFERFVCRHS